MRTKKIVRAVNWRYAVGEVFLIVAGILIALAISDWNDQRIQRQQELAMLEEVLAGLRIDSDSLSEKLEEIRAATNKMDTLAEQLAEKRPYHPDVDHLFGSVYGMQTIKLTLAPYETLKSVGLQSVSNRELRATIVQVFDHHYEGLEKVHDIEVEITTNVMRPYYLRNFVNLQFWENATPINFDEIVGDDYFNNILH